MTEGNYASTVALLKGRFGNPSALIGLYASELVAAPTVDEGATDRYRSMVDTFSSALREIKTLTEEVLAQDPSASPYDLVLAPLLLKKLPPSSRIEWSRKHTEPAARFDLESLLDFARTEVDALASLDPKTRPSSNDPHSRKQPRSSTSALLVGRPEPKQAPRIRDLPPCDRLEAVKRHRMCFLCLSTRHRASACGSTRACDTCSGKHHTLLHGLIPEKDARSTADTSSGAPLSHTLRVSAPSEPLRRTLLQTAVVNGVGVSGTTASCRALLDSGSEHSFVTRSLARHLRLPGLETRRFAVEGFGGRSTAVAQHERVIIRVENRHNGRSVDLSCWIVEAICSPLPGLPRSEQPLPADIRVLTLAETFDSPLLQIDLVVGADFLAQVMESTSPVRSGPYCAWSTVFGWVLSGPAHGTKASSSAFAQLKCLKAGTHDPSRLWDLEAIGISANDFEPQPWTPPTWNGSRYEVKLPWKEGSRPSFTQGEARRRLSSYHRLPSDKKEAYNAALSEWERSGVLEAAPAHGGSYLPHHGVSQHGKLRVVIDGSASPRTSRPCSPVSVPKDLPLRRRSPCDTEGTRRWRW